MTARKIVLIGAGSASFTQGLVADMILTGDPWDIHLVDVHPENLAVAHGVVQRMLQMRPAPITVTATADRRAALPKRRSIAGAAYCTLCSVPGASGVSGCVWDFALTFLQPKVRVPSLWQQ